MGGPPPWGLASFVVHAAMVVPQRSDRSVLMKHVKPLVKPVSLYVVGQVVLCAVQARCHSRFPAVIILVGAGRHQQMK